jgi:hypothetical protein
MKPPINYREQAVLEYLIKELERIETARGPEAERDPLSLSETRLYGEAAGIRTAIAYITGILGIKTPIGGGVVSWLPAIKEAIA